MVSNISILDILEIVSDSVYAEVPSETLVGVKVEMVKYMDRVVRIELQLNKGKLYVIERLISMIVLEQAYLWQDIIDQNVVEMIANMDVLAKFLDN
jgi:hypothetical protein